MEKTCTLCKFTTHSDFQWDLHQLSETHELAALRAERDTLREALTFIESAVQPCRDYADEMILERARRALEATHE